MKRIPSPPYKIIIDYAPSQADNDAVMEGLISFNERIIDVPRDKKFSVFLKNDLAEIVGGIQAHFDAESIYIEVLWVDERLRKKGYGKQLLDTAEQEAIKQGCKFSIVDTFDFQAEGFYLKNGYKAMGEIKKYWHEHSILFLKKIL